MTFENAVNATDQIAEFFRKGLQALRTVDRKRIRCDDPRRLAGSVDLDAALRRKQRDAAVWDYGVGLREAVASDIAVWIEVHPANSAHVEDVLKKLNWLRGWLRDHAPSLETLPGRFVWLASGAVALPANSPQRKKIASHGVHFAGSHLRLPLA